jgi:hypothetical protein
MEGVALHDLLALIIDSHPSGAYPLCILNASPLRLGNGFSGITTPPGCFLCMVRAPGKGREMVLSKNVVSITIALSLLALGMAVMPPGAAAQYIPRIDKEQLKATLGYPGLIVVDVRTAPDWNASRRMIRGAVRENPQAVQQWAGKYPKNKTIVLY